jgi:GGDEF domain-containing protein
MADAESQYLDTRLGLPNQMLWHKHWQEFQQNASLKDNEALKNLFLDLKPIMENYDPLTGYMRAVGSVKAQFYATMSQALADADIINELSGLSKVFCLRTGGDELEFLAILPNGQVARFAVDVSNLKYANDFLGREHTDAILRQTAYFLREKVEEWAVKEDRVSLETFVQQLNKVLAEESHKNGNAFIQHSKYKNKGLSGFAATIAGRIYSMSAGVLIPDDSLALSQKIVEIKNTITLTNAEGRGEILGKITPDFPLTAWILSLDGAEKQRIITLGLVPKTDRDFDAQHDPVPPDEILNTLPAYTADTNLLSLVDILKQLQAQAHIDVDELADTTSLQTIQYTVDTWIDRLQLGHDAAQQAKELLAPLYEPLSQLQNEQQFIAKIQQLSKIQDNNQTGYVSLINFSNITGLNNIDEAIADKIMEACREAYFRILKDECEKHQVFCEVYQHTGNRSADSTYFGVVTHGNKNKSYTVADKELNFDEFMAYGHLKAWATIENVLRENDLDTTLYPRNPLLSGLTLNTRHREIPNNALPNYSSVYTALLNPLFLSLKNPQSPLFLSDFQEGLTFADLPSIQIHLPATESSVPPSRKLIDIADIEAEFITTKIQIAQIFGLSALKTMKLSGFFIPENRIPDSVSEAARLLVEAVQPPKSVYQQAIARLKYIATMG